MAGWHVAPVGILEMLKLDGVDAGGSTCQRKGSDVDLVTHKVFRCFFNASKGREGWKQCAEEHAHINIDVCLWI